MKRDPFYQLIQERLNGPLDPDNFERCAADVLRSDFPGLVPIRGGFDAGMDGAIADGEGTAYPLVTTTGEKVIDNLSRNLRTYLSDGGTRRKAVLATSRELSPQRRRNLEKRAGELGFTLVQIFDRAAIAHRLYDNPHWCRELLNLAGDPPALSYEPRTRRPRLDLSPIGRDADLAWLRDTRGDRLLVGQPGSGKTFVLGTLVQEGWGLFVESDNMGRIAEDFRSKKPRILVVDDAHDRQDLLTSLRRFRAEIGADFAIVASSWPVDVGLVAGELNLIDEQARHLERLTRDEIVAVVKASGIAGPVELVREIVNQAAGLPGLAVTLADICLRGGVRELALGNALKQSVHATFEPLVGETAIEILAAFALGGNAGMDMSSVSRALGLPVVELRRAVTRLAAGGVVFHSGDSRLAVHPRTLRDALVRDVFFTGAESLPLQPLLQEAPPLSGVALALVGARSLGAEVPMELLVQQLERTDSIDGWVRFAALGREESRLVLDRHPELAVSIAHVALDQAPELVIPHLMKTAIDDGRHLLSNPQQPLRLIQDWIEASEPRSREVLRSRRTLLTAVRTWLSSEGDENVALRCLSLVLSPVFRKSSTNPGSSQSVELTWGLLPAEDLESVGALWNDCLDLVRSVDERNWELVLETVKLWTYPPPPLASAGRIPPELERVMQTVATRMVTDLATLAQGCPGILHELSRLADRLGLELDFDPEPEFEILFPTNKPEDDWNEAVERQSQAITQLVRAWAKEDPVTMLRRVERLRAEASAAGITNHWQLCRTFHALAQSIESPTVWIRAMLETGTPGFLADRILRRVAADNDPAWPDLARAGLERPDWMGVIVCAVLMTTSPPAELLSTALERLEHNQHIVWGVCLRNEAPEATVLRLLQHGNDAVAGAAAVGEWQAKPAGRVRESLSEAWRPAIVRCPAGQNGIGEVLKSDPILAIDWLLTQFRSVTRSNNDLDHSIGEAISGLDQSGRRTLLCAVPQDGFPDLRTTSIISRLVGDDLDLYRDFLAIPHPADKHLAPLGGASRTVGSGTTPNLGDTWAAKAILALDQGYTPEDVVQATFGSSWSCWGKESAMWDAWVAQFEAMREYPDDRIRLVAGLGRDRAVRSRDSALRRERAEAVYGHD
jgi:hypothetical protein